MKYHICQWNYWFGGDNDRKMEVVFSSRVPRFMRTDDLIFSNPLWEFAYLNSVRVKYDKSVYVTCDIDKMERDNFGRIHVWLTARSHDLMKRLDRGT